MEEEMKWWVEGLNMIRANLGELVEECTPRGMNHNVCAHISYTYNAVTQRYRKSALQYLELS